MKVVIQRVKNASVTISNEVVGAIEQGLLVLLGITQDDSIEDVEYLCNKIAGMRIFSDTEGKMNLSVADVKGQVLVVSQFTLYASTKKGNRPSYISAARPDVAVPLYKSFLDTLSRKLAKKVESGIFGADLQVSDKPLRLPETDL